MQREQGDNKILKRNIYIYEFIYKNILWIAIKNIEANKYCKLLL